MPSTADVTVTNPSGLHARPATELVRLVTGLTSAVQLESKGTWIDASSVLSVMAAGITCGETVTVKCDGDQADADLETVLAAFRAGLGE